MMYSSSSEVLDPPAPTLIPMVHKPDEERETPLPLTFRSRWRPFPCRVPSPLTSLSIPAEIDVETLRRRVSELEAENEALRERFARSVDRDDAKAAVTAASMKAYEDASKRLKRRTYEGDEEERRIWRRRVAAARSTAEGLRSEERALRDRVADLTLTVAYMQEEARLVETVQSMNADSRRAAHELLDFHRASLRASRDEDLCRQLEEHRRERLEADSEVLRLLLEEGCAFAEVVAILLSDDRVAGCSRQKRDLASRMSALALFSVASAASSAAGAEDDGARGERMRAQMAGLFTSVAAILRAWLGGVDSDPPSKRLRTD